MVADHPQHRLLVRLVAAERANLGCDLGRGGVGHAGEDAGNRAAEGIASRRVVGNAELHQHRAEVGIAEAEGAIVVAALGNLL